MTANNTNEKLQLQVNGLSAVNKFKLQIGDPVKLKTQLPNVRKLPIFAD